jgi:acetolactate synthase-1/2/3 large subunit
MIADYLISEGVEYVFALPGHGNSALLDAFVDRRDEITVLAAMHEQGAGHMAAGYFRSSGRPAVACVSIGPGATNTLTALTTAYADSIPLLLISGGVHTYMENRGVLQEIDRPHTNNFPRVAEPVVKRWWQPHRVEDFPLVFSQAFNTMLEGRPGPVLVDVPQDLQAELGEYHPRTARKHRPHGRPRGDALQTRSAAAILSDAARPAILAGGGVIASAAGSSIAAVAEHLGAPIIHSFMGKGAVPADHNLYAGGCGEIGTLAGNEVARNADVLLAVGCRFSDRVASSYRDGVTFSIPPTKLIQVDLDPFEIGRNYPVEVGIVGDAKAVLDDLLVELSELRGGRAYQDTSPYRELVALREEWERRLEPMRTAEHRPMTISTALAQIRRVMPRDAILVTDSGYTADQAFAEFPVYEERTNLMPGGMCEMGFGIPTAIGARLGRPDRAVVALVGDGSVLQTGAEIAAAVMAEVDLVIVALNNGGWVSITDLQMTLHGDDRELVSHFKRGDGDRFFLNIAKFAESLGCPNAQLISEPDELAGAVAAGLQAGGVVVIEVPVADALPWSGMQATGWWDVPVPEYHDAPRQSYVTKRGF